MVGVGTRRLPPHARSRRPRRLEVQGAFLEPSRTQHACDVNSIGARVASGVVRWQRADTARPVCSAGRGARHRPVGQVAAHSLAPGRREDRRPAAVPVSSNHHSAVSLSYISRFLESAVGPDCRFPFCVSNRAVATRSNPTKRHASALQKATKGLAHITSNVAVKLS